MTLCWAIVISDIDALVTEGLARLLEEAGHSVRIAAATHAGARAQVRAFEADACILDLWLRDGHDAGQIERLVAENPSLKVIVRTADWSAGALQATLAAGAVGYLHKSRSASLLPAMLRRIADGEIAVETSFTQDALTGEGLAADAKRLIDLLTQRERECLNLIIEGRSTGAMAAQIGVSTATVRTHIQSVLAKLGVHSRLEAAALVSRHLPTTEGPYQLPTQQRRPNPGRPAVGTRPGAR